MQEFLGIPSNGRMKEDSLAYLKGLGLRLSNGHSSLFINAGEGLDGVFLDYKDIAKLLDKKKLPFGITTSAALLEYGRATRTLRSLGFSRCRLAFATVSQSVDLSSWDGRVVATKYPKIARVYFDQQKRSDIVIIDVSGSVEAYPAIGCADGIVDIVQSGKSLLENGLHENDTVMQVEAVLAGSSHVTSNEASAWRAALSIG